MPNRPKLNSDNSFCWVELACSNMAKAKDFYGSVMGWKFIDDPMPGGGVYTHIKLGNKGLVGGLYEFSTPASKGKKTKEPKMPAFWGSYVATNNIEATVKKAKKNGGSVALEVMDLGQSGKISVIQDPVGAMFGLWEKKKHGGFGNAIDVAGAAGWNELLTPNEKQSLDFYKKVFNWKIKDHAFDELTYSYFTAKDKHVAGLMRLNPELGEIPSHWLVYFNSSNVDKSTKLVVEKGGQVLFPPTSFKGVARMSVVMDPEGASFALIKYV